VTLAVLAGLLAGYGVAQETTTQVAAIAPAPEGLSRGDIARLRSGGLKDALDGDFAIGLGKLKQAAAADAGDPIAREAVVLLDEHLKAWNKSAQGRSEEYQRAVERVGHSRVAQAYMDKADEKQSAAIREAVEKVIESFNGCATGEVLEDSPDANETGRLRAKSVQKLAEAQERLDKALAALPASDGEYFALFRRLSGMVKTALAEYKKAWEAVPSGDGQKMADATRAVREAEYRLTDNLADLEAIIVVKPWQVMLGQARLAMRLASEKDKGALKKDGWLGQVVRDAESRGEAFVKEGKWSDAFNVWGSLKELLDGEEKYDQKSHVALRHVRVLRMYGPRPTTASAPATKPAGGDGGDGAAVDEEGPAWREAVAGVDADMVEKVIRQLDRSYVAAIDYRKLARGALVSVQVLAEAPQVRETFAALKDDGKRNAFLKAIDEQIQTIEKRERPDHLDLILAMNSVLAASDKTVNIPVEVLCVEFTDGFLDELDKFSSMIWPADVADFEKQTMGHFCGVGIQIAKEPGQPLKVVTPLLDTPAYKLGIKAGDFVVKVDGKATERLSIDKLVKMIMGEKGTKVVLTVKRAGRMTDYTVVRDRIDILTVRGWKRDSRSNEWDYFVDPNAGVGYIRVTQFTEKTIDGIDEALKKMQDKGARSVIMDLRFNPGGLLRSATDVANEFLMGGRIVSTRGRRTRPTEVNADPKGRFLDGDLVVLVNEYSASAAEIVSGALKDWGRAKIVGTRTYGKGSVQNVIAVRRDSALLKLTTAYYYLPKGRLLHRENGAKEWGVDPDIEVFLTPRETRRWLDIRRRTDIVQEEDSDVLKDDLNRQYRADVQLETAVLVLKLMRLQQKARAA
jgi:carboxyl-terminal processing protease